MPAKRRASTSTEDSVSSTTRRNKKAKQVNYNQVITLLADNCIKLHHITHQCPYDNYGNPSSCFEVGHQIQTLSQLQRRLQERLVSLQYLPPLPDPCMLKSHGMVQHALRKSQI